MKAKSAVPSKKEASIVADTHVVVGIPPSPPQTTRTSIEKRGTPS